MSLPRLAGRVLLCIVWDLSRSWGQEFTFSQDRRLTGVVFQRHYSLAHWPVLSVCRGCLYKKPISPLTPNIT